MVRWPLRYLRTAALLVATLVCLWPQSVRAHDVNVTIGVGDTTVQMIGYAPAASLVTFLDGSQVIGTTIADAAGHYSHILTDQTPGIHTYGIFAHTQTGEFTDTITISLSVTQHAQTTVDSFLPPTLQLSGYELSPQQSLHLSGTTLPLATVVLSIDTTYLTTVADMDGLWQYTLEASQLPAGSHSLYGIAIRAGGQQSHPTHTRHFSIIPPASPSPTPPITTPKAPSLPSPPPAPIITSPRSGESITDPSVEVTGTSLPHHRIELWNQTQLIAVTVADAAGRWRLHAPLLELVNELRARACRATLCGDYSTPVTIFHPTRDNLPRIWLNTYTTYTTTSHPANMRLSISGGTPPYAITILWGDGTREVIHTRSAPMLLSHVFTRVGSFNGTITVTDAQQHRTSVSFATMVSEEPRPFNYLIIAAMLALLLIAWLASRVAAGRKRRESS